MEIRWEVGLDIRHSVDMGTTASLDEIGRGGGEHCVGLESNDILVGKIDVVDWDTRSDTEERRLVDWYRRKRDRWKDHRQD
jgi:hypothetical protein